MSRLRSDRQLLARHHPPIKDGPLSDGGEQQATLPILDLPNDGPLFVAPPSGYPRSSAPPPCVGPGVARAVVDAALFFFSAPPAGLHSGSSRTFMEWGGGATKTAPKTLCLTSGAVIVGVGVLVIVAVVVVIILAGVAVTKLAVSIRNVGEVGSSVHLPSLSTTQSSFPGKTATPPGGIVVETVCEPLFAGPVAIRRTGRPGRGSQE